jgi:hypothetical protein
MMGSDYENGFWIVGVIAFLASWIYAVAQYGFFLGVGLGWLPAAAIGFIAGLLWPLVVLVVGALVLFVLWAGVQ